MTAAERIAVNARDRARAIERARAREARCDAEGRCRKCGGTDRRAGKTTCQPCADRGNELARKRAGATPALTPSTRLVFCVDCAAAGFHRAGCPGAA